MQRTITNLLATASVLFGASTGSAFSVTMTSDYDGSRVLSPGDTVNVELFLDADAIGIQLLSVAVIFDEDIFSYVPQTLAATGTPTYILFGGVGRIMTMLLAQHDPWELWSGLPPGPGQLQVNVNWAENSFNGTFVTGLGIKIAGIQLQVIGPGDGFGEVILSSTASGNLLQVNDVVVPLPVSGSFTVLPVPESTTAVLVGLGLLGLGAVGRSRARGARPAWFGVAVPAAQVSGASRSAATYSAM